MKPAVGFAPALSHRVAGESHQVCTGSGAHAEYLTSPWTYDRLKRGRKAYTVGRYEELPGYGTTLPPLPSYIASEPARALAAVIYAPGANVNFSSYQVPFAPVLNFFEGGSFGSLNYQAVSGTLFIGGSARGYPEPTFSGGGIAAGQDSYGWSGGAGLLTNGAVKGAGTIDVGRGLVIPSGYHIIFPGGAEYEVSKQSGAVLALSHRLRSTEPAGTPFWYDYFGPVAEVSLAAPKGASSLRMGRSTSPVLPRENLVVGTAVVSLSGASGSEATGYSVTLSRPLSQAVAAGTPVYYQADASDVSVEYLDFDYGGNHPGNILTTDTGGGAPAGTGWTIEHDWFHDDYAGGTNYAETSAQGIAVYGGDGGTIEYNCFERLGSYAINAFGHGTTFDYNQVTETPYNPDLSGNGQTGCGKWWATLNADVVGNAFTDEYRSVCVWFDDGNTGMLVKGNYFYDIDNRAVMNETGYNSEYIGNFFQDVANGIYLNDSGGWSIPSSRYDNEVLVEANTFDNAQQALEIWGASGRSCLNSGEAAGAESDPYCSGGYPQEAPANSYFSHYFDSGLWPVATVAANQTCSASSPCSTVALTGTSPGSPAIGDWVGFAGQDPDNCPVGCGPYAADPVQTSTTDRTDVSSFTGSGTIDVASTAGFPGSGQLIVNTSCGALYLATGAVVSYSGTTSSSFTGVKLVSGCGTLKGTVEAVQPYKVTAVSCPGGNCTSIVVTLSPPLTAGLTAGTDVYSTGTCAYYDTAAATPSSPVAPDGTSYYDGCMWEDRNITVEANSFEVDPATFSSTPLPDGESGDWSCTTGPSGNCAQNGMGYQYPGGDAAPYDNPVLSNAMMSDSSLPAPYNNLNAPGSPLVGPGSGVAANGEQPYDDLWTSNTYSGDWTFQAYVQGAGCPLNWTGSSLEWVGSAGGNACSGLSVSKWQAIWHQD